jgi:hypothetical protein
LVPERKEHHKTLQLQKKKCMESDKEGFSLLTQERCHPAQLSFGLQLSSPLGPAARL